MANTNQVVPAHIRGEKLVRIIIGVNIFMYVLSLMLDHSHINFSMNPLATLGPGVQSLIKLGATGTVPINHSGAWWSLIAANYLHGGLLHLLFNMIAFYQLAPFVATVYGVHRMFVIYTVGGIIGFLASYLAGIQLTIGASAGICSLMGAILYFGKSFGGELGNRLYRQIGKWIIGMFAIGLVIHIINNWGHGGGIVGGVACGYLLGYKAIQKETRFHQILSYICGIVTILALLWGILIAIATS